MEKNLWSSLNKIQRLDPDMYMMRVETTTINGVPDVHACHEGHSFWLELKANDDKKYGLSKYQIIWQIDYLNVGGNVFNLVLAPSQRALKLVRLNPALFSFCTGFVPHEKSFQVLGSKPYNKKNLQSIIKLASDSCH